VRVGTDDTVGAVTVVVTGAEEVVTPPTVVEVVVVVFATVGCAVFGDVLTTAWVVVDVTVATGGGLGVGTDEEVVTGGAVVVTPPTVVEVVVVVVLTVGCVEVGGVLTTT
jgi:hypothetical protein